MWHIRGAAGALEQLLQKHTQWRALGGKSRKLVVDLVELRGDKNADVTFAALKSMDREELLRQLVLCADELDWRFLVHMCTIKYHLPQSICLPMKSGVLVAVLDATGERQKPIPVHKDDDEHFGNFTSEHITNWMETDTQQSPINALLETTICRRIFLFCEHLPADKKTLSKIYCLRAAAVPNGDNLHGDAYELELMTEEDWTYGLPPGWKNLGFHVHPPNGDYTTLRDSSVAAVRMTKGPGKVDMFRATEDVCALAVLKLKKKRWIIGTMSKFVENRDGRIGTRSHLSLGTHKWPSLWLYSARERRGGRGRRNPRSLSCL